MSFKNKNKLITKIKLKKNEIFIVSTFLIMTLIFFSSLYYINSKDNTINNNFIAVFKGEFNNTVYSTYVYEKKKTSSNKTKTEYKYINTTTTTQLDSTNYIEKVTKKGTTKKKKKIFEVAEKNKASSYVIWKSDSKVYSIKEFRKFFK